MTVTSVSACMVNDESVGILQHTGNKNWWSKNMPKNITVYSTLKELESANPKAAITDRTISTRIKNNVIYRPPSLVVGIGLHHDTTKQTISHGINTTLEKFNLSLKSVSKIVSIKKPVNVQGLEEYCNEQSQWNGICGSYKTCRNICTKSFQDCKSI